MKRCLTLVWTVGILFLSFALLEGCSDPQPPIIHQTPKPVPPARPSHGQHEAVKVGVLLPLSGPQQKLGKAFLKAAELALFEGNTPQGNLTLVPKNTKGTTHGAQEALRACVAEGVSAFLGPIFAFEVQAIRPILCPSTAPMLTFSTDTQILGEGIFTLGFLPKQQIKEVVASAAKDGITRIAVILPKTPYGSSVLNDLEHPEIRQLATLEVVGRYDPKQLAVSEAASQELQPALEALNHGNFQAVLIPEGGKNLERVLHTFQREGFEKQNRILLGTSQWDRTSLAHLPYMEGARIAVPTQGSGHQQFQRQFSVLYSAQTPRLASLAYDGVMLLRNLASEPGGISTSNLLKDSGFSGVDGEVRFLRDGENERKIEVLRFSGGKFITLTPTPPAF